MNEDENELLTTDEVAKFLRIEIKQVYRLIKAGKLPALNVGMGTQRPDYRVFKKDIINLLKVKQS